MKYPKGALEANIKRAEIERKERAFKIPETFLTALQKRGQDGKQVLRGRKQTKGK